MPAATAGGTPDGAALFDQRCAACHGDQGQGKIGPSLHGVAEKYPDIEGHILVVEQGRGVMPSFRSTLSKDEIRAVVEFERATFLADGDEVAAEG